MIYLLMKQCQNKYKKDKNMNYRSINFFTKTDLIKTIHFLQGKLNYNRTPKNLLLSSNVKTLITKARSLKNRSRNLKQLTWNTILSKSKTVVTG